MPYHDESQLRQLQLRVQEELAQARADLERETESSTQPSDPGERLEQIDRELTKLQRSHGLLFRSRRDQAVLSLLFSERLLLDDLGYDSYADYLSDEVEGRPLDADAAAQAELARRELASDQDRLTDIENGVLDLDWLANGCPELSLVDPLEPGAAFSPGPVDGSAEPGVPLEAWRNPFAIAADPAPITGRPSGLPRLDADESRTVDLPYWTENESA